MATSSASQPALVAGMLDDLDVAAGVNPSIVCGDGATGSPGGDPYDRIQVTYAVPRIAPAWITQTRPGGLIVAPWRTQFSNVGAVVRLKVEYGIAVGPFTHLAEFMVDRYQRTDRPDRADYIPGPEWPPDTREGKATIAPDTLWSDPAPLIVGMAVPDVVHNHRDDENTTWLYSLTCRPWAMGPTRPPGHRPVRPDGHGRPSTRVARPTRQPRPAVSEPFSLRVPLRRLGRAAGAGRACAAAIERTGDAAERGFTRRRRQALGGGLRLSEM